MTDLIDVAQRRQLETIEHALANRPAARTGLAQCEAPGCGEPISPMRQAMGATRCVECQTAHEQEAQRWAPRAHG